MSFFHFIN